MKKFFIISIITNVLISILAFFGLMNYLELSISYDLGTFIDGLVLAATIALDVVINYVIYRILKLEENKVFILIPSIIFMLIIGILFMFVK